MKIGQELLSRLGSGLRVPRVLLGMAFLCTPLGVLSGSDRPVSYIGIGAAVLAVFAWFALVAIQIIRQRKIFVRNLLLGAITYTVCACLWRWRTLAHKDATILWMNIRSRLVVGAYFMLCLESIRLAFPVRSRLGSVPNV